MDLQEQLAKSQRVKAQRVLDLAFPALFSITSSGGQVKVFAGRRFVFGLRADDSVELADVLYGWACWLSTNGYNGGLEVE